jgi:hypothetical protein
MVRAILLGLSGGVCLLLALTVVLSQPVWAEEGADELWAFANSLYQEEDFHNALGEYQRFRFLFPNDPRTLQAEFQIGRCYRQDGQPENAVSQFLRLYRRKSEEPIAPEALLEVVAIREEQNMYPEAIIWLQHFIENYPEDPEIDALYYRLAWLQIDSSIYEQAVATLVRIRPQSGCYERARSLSQALEGRENIPRKSPSLAGGLSAVLPGAGHLYVGRPAEAVSSFLLNALFIGAAVAAFKHDSPVLGGILIFFELGWYQGGIRSAATAAREENERHESEYRQELKDRFHLSLGLVPAMNSMALSLQLSF